MNIFKALLLTLSCVFILSAAPHPKPKTSLPFKRLAALEKQGVQVSVMAIRMKDNKILAQVSPTKHLIPASTTKMVVAADALETWSPEKTFRSTLLRRGNVTDGVLNGDLIFYGGGDPALINEKLAIFTDNIVKSGIKRVTGKFIVNNSLFGNFVQDNTRIGVKEFSQNAYDSQLSAAAVNFSILGVIINPGADAGASARISLDPFDLPSVSIVNSVKTTKNGSQTSVAVSRATKDGKDIYTVTGNIALDGSEQRIYRSVSNPDRYAGEVLVAYLQDAGIDIDDSEIMIDSQPPRPTDQIVATLDGFTLSEQLQFMLKISNNFIADMLLMDLSVAAGTIQLTPNKPLTIQNHSVILQKYMRSIANDKTIVLKSGSGLTTENQLSAQNLIALLKHIYKNKDEFQIFLNSLTIPGQIGTFHSRFKEFSSPYSPVLLRAKTGTLTEPYPVVSLAGYSKGVSGDWIGFAVIINGTNAKHSPEIDELRRALDNDVTDFLRSRTAL